MLQCFHLEHTTFSLTASCVCPGAANCSDATYFGPSLQAATIKLTNTARLSFIIEQLCCSSVLQLSAAAQYSCYKADSFPVVDRLCHIRYYAMQIWVI